MTMKKRLLSLCLVICMLTGLLAVGAAAADAEVVDSGECGANSGSGNSVAWTFYSDGLLEVLGSGDVVNYHTINNVEWSDYLDEITSAVVGEGVTSLGSYMFYNCVNLQEVSLPGTLETINTSAFQYCSSLEEIDLPESLTTIGATAFYGCTSLEEITIPDGVESISSSLLASCTSLTAVNLPESVTAIKSLAFSGCTSLTEIDLPAGVTGIGKNAFLNCSALTSVVFGEALTSLDDSAFAGCTGLEEIRFEGSAPAFGEDVFSGVTAAAYYPAADESWTADVLQDYGGTITWIAVDEDGNPVGQAAFTFTDDTDTGAWSWASDYIYACYEQGIITGYADSDGYSFLPANNLTRAEAAAIIARACGLTFDADAAYTVFSDDDGTGAWSWADEYIYACVQAGIINGYSDGTFLPSNNVTRVELAKMIAAAEGLTLDASESSFSDVADTHWGLPYIEACVQAGIVNGYTDGTFLPANNVTRAEAAAMIARALGLAE